MNKGHKVDIFNKEISSIDFFCSRTERVKTEKCQMPFLCHKFLKQKAEKGYLRKYTPL